MLRRMKRSKIALGSTALLLLASALACGGGNDNLPPPPPPPPPPPASTVAMPSPASALEDAGPPAPSAPAVTLQSGTASPDPAAPLPTVQVVAPAKGQVVAAKDAPDFAIKLDVKNWQTATGSSHVHLILDNRPYKAIYDPKKPIKLSELTGGEAINEGQHVLVAFPSRANHESVKTKGALVVTEFWIGKKGTPAVDLKKPMLIYSRPKGDYKGDMANHVLIDFQLASATLGAGSGGDKAGAGDAGAAKASAGAGADHVHVAVTGPGIDKELTAHVEKFGVPYYLDNLRNGTYTIHLALMGADDAPVPGPWNDTTRKINIDHDAQPDPMPGMPGMPGMGGGADAGAPAPSAPAKPVVSKPVPGPATPAKPKP